jgi:hypothetical protein
MDHDKEAIQHRGHNVCSHLVYRCQHFLLA